MCSFFLYGRDTQVILVRYHGDIVVVPGGRVANWIDRITALTDEPPPAMMCSA